MCYIVHHSPSQKHLFISNCVFVGASHGDSTTQHPWSWLVIHASRVSWCWLCRSQKWAFCPTHLSVLLSWNALVIMTLQLCKTFAQNTNVVQPGEICLLVVLELTFSYLCRALFQVHVFWFYFSSADQPLLWECCSVCWTMPIFGERKIGWSGLLPLCCLKWDLSFPVLVFWVLFKLRAGGGWDCRCCNSDPTEMCLSKEFRVKKKHLTTNVLWFPKPFSSQWALPKCETRTILCHIGLWRCQ